MKAIKSIAMQSADTGSIPIAEVAARIVALSLALRDFWSGASGWAQSAAASLPSTSRLDRQVSLSEALNLWLSNDDSQLTDGELILAWANLGSLVEGTMRLFLSVYYADYANDDDAQKVWKTGNLVDPDGIKFDLLIQFFAKKALLPAECVAFVKMVQSRRNAIHAFKDKDIGTTSDYAKAVRQYLTLVREINGRLPYPE